MYHSLKKYFKVCAFILSFFFSSKSRAEVVPKQYTAKLTSTEIKIDGNPNDDAWRLANVADNFAQLDPNEGASITQLTEVKLLYDNNAIYILAVMHDTHADSILHQLGNRDEAGNLNADAFRFGLDTYNKRENGYVFEVSASGVQSEWFDDDITFDAVWQSAVQINDSGWIAELKIPYSALRFPAADEQQWGVQFARFIRRNREYDQWTLTPKNIQNRMLYWGTLNGIKNIDPPLRLSLTPYLSVYGERAPLISEGINNGYQNSYSYYGGADVKFGIDERFTLDMTLLPDFSQVQSDNKVKNLSAFETIYEERRPFFKEGTSLFSKGDLLYTRRIGHTPKRFYDAPGYLNEGDVLEENPDKARLINATKISGRTDGGLGIGLLNAISGNTYAVIKEPGGNRRKILTDPLTNYNLFIFDQQLKNNCNIFLVNTNVIRNGRERDANVTTASGRLENKKHTYRFTGSYSASRIYKWDDHENGDAQKQRTIGEKYVISGDKISGNTWFGGTYEHISKNYDKNDFGYNFFRDYTQVRTYFSFYKFNPFWKYFKQGDLTFWANRSGRLSSHNNLMTLESGFNIFLLFMNNWSLFTETGFIPQRTRDYYEPRIEGRYYRGFEQSFGSVNVTTNYNKRLAFDFGSRYSYTPEQSNFNLGYYVIPRVRISDRFTVSLSHYYDKYDNDVGFAFRTEGSDSVFFGQRNITTIENTINSRYLFKNDMSLSLTARHYWSKGVYNNFYYLDLAGELYDEIISNPRDYDFNSNYLTVDLVYNWQFAPGSSFIITYKNLILSDDVAGEKMYFDNLSKTFSRPQINSLSLKFLYYLDYQYIVKK